MTLRQRWTAWRDRLTTNASFRAWAATNPVTRPIARARAKALFDLCAGFVYSQILAACVELQLFDALREGPASAQELADRLHLPVANMRRLLEAAAALQLCDKRSGDTYGLGPLGAALIDNPGVIAMVRHHAILYADLRDPVALLRGERGERALEHFWPYTGSGRDAALAHSSTQPYSDLMAASQAMVSNEILAAYPLAEHRHLLDIGGGNGTFALAAARRAPHLRITTFDLPSVAELAERNFARHGLSDRIQARGGDFFRDSLPRGADVAILVRVLHDHDDDDALLLLRAARNALAGSATILVAEPMADSKGGEAANAAYFGFYLLAMGRGRPRTTREIFALLEAAQFSGMRRIATSVPLIAGLIAAQAK